MAKRTPEQEALYALQWDLARDDLPMAAQLEYDQLTRQLGPRWARGSEPWPARWRGRGDDAGLSGGWAGVPGSGAAPG
jgi:hypothetical protein